MPVTAIRHRTLKVAVAAAFFVWATATPVALAAAPAAEKSVADVCSPVPRFDEAAILPYLDMVLVPGRKIEIAKIDQATMAKFAALQKDAAERQKTDWANLCRYAPDNARMAATNARRVVFLGDSITEYWRTGDPSLFSGNVLDRGISGQTTAQILLRFYPDVVALKPRAVHIMAGTNDVAGNLGPVSDDTIIANLAAMVDLARANRIAVVLASIPPAKFLSWKPGVTPAARIATLNARLKALAAARGAVFVDYHASLRDEQGGFRAALANDGVHPNRDGYAIMGPLAQRALAQATKGVR